jgi:hypothetical protein
MGRVGDGAKDIIGHFPFTISHFPFARSETDNASSNELLES